MIRRLAASSHHTGPPRPRLASSIAISLFVLAGPFADHVHAWREDPRAATDTPAGVAGPGNQRGPSQPQAGQGRRGSRRSQRRVSRRRQPLDELPIDTAPAIPPPGSAVRTDSLETDGFDGCPETMRSSFANRPAGGCPAPGAAASPIPIDATLASPFPASEAGQTGVTAQRDQPYGRPHGDRPREKRQRFDLHLPAGCSGGGMPLVVWIHGDTWRDGSKADCPVVWLANRGYAVASIGYRLSDTALFPAQLDDCREAVAEIQRNAELWGIDRSRVAVVGSGGGGHLAALVGLTAPATATATDDDALPEIAAVCAVAAPTNLTTLGAAHDRAGSPASRLVGGPLPEFREAAQRASPVSHVSPDDPPVLILHGAADDIVPVNQAVDFAALLEAAEVDGTLVILPDAGHGLPLGPETAAGQTLLSFLDRVLGAGIRPGRGPRP